MPIDIRDCSVMRVKNMLDGGFTDNKEVPYQTAHTRVMSDRSHGMSRKEIQGEIGVTYSFSLEVDTINSAREGCGFH
jgi:hypothetical protein